MTKLVSLAEKPATEEDVGKIFYYVYHNEVSWRELEIKNIDYYNKHGHEYFWNKPKLISEQEYKELKELKQALIKDVAEIERLLDEEIERVDDLIDNETDIKILNRKLGMKDGVNQSKQFIGKVLK